MTGTVKSGGYHAVETVGWIATTVWRARAVLRPTARGRSAMTFVIADRPLLHLPVARRRDETFRRRRLPCTFTVP
ncbi:hypothetical protein [Nonomuraea sp. NPDC001699]